MRRSRSSSPLRVCMSFTTCSMRLSTSGGWWMTRSGPSATISRSSSVTSVAISTMTSRAGVEAGHLEIHPGEHRRMVCRGLRSPDARTGRRARRPARSRAAAAELRASRRRRRRPRALARTPRSRRAAAGRSCRPASRSPSPSATPGSCSPAAGWRCATASRCLNTPGLIDAGYRDELKVLLVNTDPTEPYHVHRGDRIAQLVIQRVEACAFREVDTLEGENRGGGFGHTGR